MGKEAVIAAGDRNAAAAEPQQAKRTGLPRRLVEYQVEQPTTAKPCAATRNIRLR